MAKGDGWIAGLGIGMLVFWFLFMGLALTGYILNIVHICEMDFSGPVTGLLVVRCVGIVAAPLGAICGWFF